MRKPIFLSVLLLFGCSPSGTFDSERWKNADLSTRDRAEIVDNLLAKHSLDAMQRSQVIELLG